MSKKLSLPPSYLSALESYFDLPLEDPIPKKLQPFTETIAEMSSGLKKKEQRTNFVSSTYLDESQYSEAYLLYYTTCNLLKIYYPLTELERSGYFSKLDSMRLLDLGCGTGTMTLGTSFWFHDRYPQLPLHTTAWDRSDTALRTFEKFYKTFGWADKLQTFQKDIGAIVPPDENFHLIIGGNILNELTAAGEERLIEILEKCLSPEGFVILIEPALKVSSRQLLQLRDRLLQKDWFVYAPCFTQNPCPALTHEDDWCHHDLDWERPDFITVIDEKIGHIRKSLKFSYLILSRKDVHLSDFVFPQRNFSEQFRVVSEIFKEKGRRRLFVCNDHGRCECMKNNRDDSADNEAFDALQRYDIAEISGLNEKKEMKQITKATSVRRLEQ